MDRHLLLACCVSHAVQRGLDPRGDERLFDQGIRRDDVNRLGALGGRELADGRPNELERGARIFAAAVADDPRNRIGQVEFANLVAYGLDGLGEADTLKDRFG